MTLIVGKDVAAALGYSNPQKALRDHVDDDDKTVNDSFTVNGTQAILINESGLYSLALSSKLPGAKKFRSDFGLVNGRNSTLVGGRLKIEPSDFS